MELQLKGKRALISGGSRGIGKATAKLLAMEGAHVAIMSRDEASLNAAVNELRTQTGGTVTGLVGDTNDDLTVPSAADITGSLGGSADILVNAAAEPLGRHAPPRLAEITSDALLSEVNTKVAGYIRMAQAVTGGMRDKGWGRIVNISGLAARTTGNTIGSIRNVAVAALTKNLADELGQDGISVNGVHPGFTRTERTAALFAHLAEQQGKSVEAVEAQFAAANSLHRIIDAEEVARVIVFLCSPLASAINGEMVPVGGGIPNSIYY